ncbi:MAG: hypothetical protein RLZZ360_118 [Candidatus Parcubacteria bacterium]|jgi:hypothetical protein
MELDQHRDAIVSSMKPVQKYLYSSSYSGQRLSALATTYALGEKYYEFAITIGDIILGFYKIEDTVPLLQQELGLDPKTAALLGAEVLEFLAPLNDPTWQPPMAIGDADESEAITANNATSSSPQEPAINRIPLKSPALFAMPATTPPPVAATLIEPVPVPAAAPMPPETPIYTPTPAGYTANHEPTPVYQSSQPMPAPLSSIPSYTPAPTPPAPAAPTPAPDRPRWSTEI